MTSAEPAATEDAAGDQEEEMMVLLEFDELEDTKFLSRCQSYSLIGLETPTPILKLDNYIFRGTYEDIIGTGLLFADQDPDGHSESQPAPKYVGSATKKIRFKRILLEPKNRES
mmetsp:Transcript_5084/g.8741  ORF Transcript_5084/g.8741 Transcript_5084/m.8741 type:complete len:114 (-) Transcript_5084:374-715(-)|eukprot:CAMPEP_0196668508 /NCGR_PEP_ID=MMETSP1086-20130531/65658_1 /TAXON_ID=77921 /ORGANISM="Cyanoptyche  gloeocystis , Strain SAG4.97" /LENGTH=113 /DNA_ID=CAMNT_0042005921 /DNA_START=46 /DNA_END=387 /DNA_ORIENTATION=+